MSDKNRPRPGMSGNTLFGLMGAVVGAAGASVGPPPACCEHHDPVVEDIQCCDECPAAEGEEWASLNTGNPGELERRARLELERGRVDADGVASLRASAAALDVHAALNTYEVAAGTPAGVERIDPSMVRVVGSNGRRLIARWDADGLWLGGCLITDREHAEALAAFITREDGSA